MPTQTKVISASKGATRAAQNIRETIDELIGFNSNVSSATIARLIDAETDVLEIRTKLKAIYALATEWKSTDDFSKIAELAYIILTKYA